jgi:hypothetical protein
LNTSSVPDGLDHGISEAESRRTLLLDDAGKIELLEGLFGELVVDMQRGNDAIGNYASSKTPLSGLGHPSIEDQLYLFGPTDIQVFADYIFKEDSPADGAIQNLGRGEFDL